MFFVVPPAKLSPHKIAIAGSRRLARELVALADEERTARHSCSQAIERARLLKDAWGTPFILDCVDRPQVRSAGADARFETEDDMQW